MTLPQLIEAYHDITELSEKEVLEALDMLFDIDQFARQNITQADAESITLSNKHFVSEYLKYHYTPLEVVTPTIVEHLEAFGYHLAMSEPAIATELLDELLYWREQGRI